MTGKTKVLSVHKLRRNARRRERLLQYFLDVNSMGSLRSNAVPEWACGVRVEKAGMFQWAVVATSERGR